MAQRIGKSKDKNTSFGKKSSAEKAFRSKKKPASNDSFGEKRSFSKPFRKFDAKDDARSFKKPFQKRDGDSDYSKKSGFSKPFRSEGSDEKSFRRSGPSSFGKPSYGKGEGDFKKPFKRRGEGSPDSDRPRFSKPFRTEGSEDRPFRKSSSSPSFGKQGYGKSEGDFKRPFKRRDEGGQDSAKPRFSKPFRAEGGEDKPFRKTSQAGGSFGRPGKFEKPGPKGYPSDFKKVTKKEVDSPKTEKQSRFEEKSGDKAASKPFTQKKVFRSGPKPFKPKTWEEKPSDGLIRLNKYIANSGVCSRREADNLITMGLISVNKETITELGYKVKPGDQVRYEDKLLKAEKPVYILLNKPKGFITTTDDPQERNTVMNLVANACKERIYPVGRLDRNTTGLLLLTNDGDLAEKLMHPSYLTKKIYRVELDKPLTKNDFIKIQEGVRLPEGKAMVDDVAMISDDSKIVGLEIHIGWNRVVRRIFETLGYTVEKLDRSVYAGLDKKDLGRGEWRFLKPEEIVSLKHFKG